MCGLAAEIMAEYANAKVLSYAPHDTHTNQVQLCLERGVPSILFSMARCSKLSLMLISLFTSLDSKVSQVSRDACLYVLCMFVSYCHLRMKICTYTRYPRYQFPVPPGSFDMVTCKWCWHWIGSVSIGQWFLEVDRVLRPGGYFVIFASVWKIHDFKAQVT